MVRPDPAPEPIAAPAADVPRLKGQNGVILAWLRKGDVTNAELSKVSLKYTSRISDIRKWLNQYEPGTKIIYRRDSDRPGVTVYSLQKG